MKRIILFTVLLLLLYSGNALAQSDTCANGDALVINTSTKRYQCITPGSTPAGTGTTMLVANDTVTGTTVNRLAKLTGAPSKAIITATSDTENAIGIVTSGAGTAGNATVTIIGQASCQFDGGTTAGNYFVISTVTAGMCHDAGATFPTSGATYGRVLSTNAGAGTYVVEIMTPDIAFQNAGNGKSKPGGSNLDYQYNSTNQFAGGRLKQENTNIVSVNGGLNTPQTFKVYASDNGSGASRWTQIAQNAGNDAQEILSTAAGGATIQNMEFRVAGGAAGASVLLGTSGMVPRGDRGLDLGSTGNRWNQIVGFSVIVSGGAFATNGGWQMGSYGDGFLNFTAAGGDVNQRFTFGDINGGISLQRDSGQNTYFSIRSGDATVLRWLNLAGNEFTSAQFDKTDTTLANVTGLVSESLTAGKTYSFVAELFVDADVTGGSKYAIAGTATATAIKYHVLMICDATNLNVITSRQTALAGSAGQAGCTAGLTRISGTITVSAAGTLAVQFAQNAANGTSSVLTMSKFEVRLLN